MRMTSVPPDTPIIMLTRSLLVTSILVSIACVFAPAANASVPAVDIRAIDGTSGRVSLREGGRSKKLAVRLISQPSDNVELLISPHVLGKVEISHAHLHFSKQDWSIPRHITISAIDDRQPSALTPVLIEAIASGGIVAGYAHVTIRDDDPLYVIRSRTSRLLTSGARTTVYTMTLGRMPTAKVNVNVISENSIAASQRGITFTPENWFEPQTIVVTSRTACRGNAMRIRHVARSRDHIFQIRRPPAVRFRVESCRST
jgi:hypothetical protein